MRNRPDKTERGREEEWARMLERGRRQRLGSGMGAFSGDTAALPEGGSGDDLSTELDWAAQLERARMRGNMALRGGLALPGPGAAAAAAPASSAASAIGKPLSMPQIGGGAPKKDGGSSNSSFMEAQAPSSIETAKVAAQVASGVGLGKLAAEELKGIGMAATKGLLAAATAAWSAINKYGLWFLFFGFASIVFEEPFISAPAILLVIWAWAVAAHWWPRPKWLRKLNVLEWLCLLVMSFIYVLALILIIILIAMVGCAMDGSCLTELVEEMGFADILSFVR